MMMMIKLMCCVCVCVCVRNNKREGDKIGEKKKAQQVTMISLFWRSNKIVNQLDYRSSFSFDAKQSNSLLISRLLLMLQQQQQVIATMYLNLPTTYTCWLLNSYITRRCYLIYNHIDVAALLQVKGRHEKHLVFLKGKSHDWQAYLFSSEGSRRAR